MSKKPVTCKLKDRWESEEKFHNTKYGNKDSLPAHYKLNPTYSIFLIMKAMLGDINDRKILEYGCGDGWITLELAEMGGIIDTFDISSEAVRQTADLLRTKNVAQNCTVTKMSAEELQYPDNSFDIVFGFAILHHLELKKGISELYRVMKPGGIAYFAEPLGTNPILNLYRKLTPQYRTPDEQPLNLVKFSQQCSQFAKVSHQEFYLTSLFPLFLANLPLFRKTSALLYGPLTKLDDFLLTRFTPLGKFAWYSILTLTK